MTKSSDRFCTQKKIPFTSVFQSIFELEKSKIIFKDRKQSKTENINTDDDLTLLGVIQIRINKDRIRINST